MKQKPLELIYDYARSGFIAIGYISYNYLKYTDIGVSIRYRDSCSFPDIYFCLYKKSDSLLDSKLADYMNKLKNRSPESGNSNVEISSIKAKNYTANVNRILDYISAGDVYQVNLSHLTSVRHIINPLETFVRYYREQPVPYALYLDCTGFKILSGSMELFLERTGNLLRTKPIKGTRKRDTDIKRDAQLKSELFTNTKERAENLMIVDLMRNDLSRICKVGSVKVDELFDIKSYSTLFQMESTISGILKDNMSFNDIIYHIFPPGSVTGAPKKRSIQIIDELEDHYRGPYCGCAGVLRPDGGFTLSVSIRTGVVKNDNICYWAGSGIVSDSVPNSEYLESLLKSRAFFDSLI